MYNLNEDPTEQLNLIESQPDRAELLSQVLYELDGRMQAPLWPTTSERRITIDYPDNQEPDGDVAYILWNN